MNIWDMRFANKVDNFKMLYDDETQLLSFGYLGRGNGVKCDVQITAWSVRFI